MKEIKYDEYKKTLQVLAEEIDKECCYEKYGIKQKEYFLLYEENGIYSLGAYIKAEEKQFVFPAFKNWTHKLFGVKRFRLYIKDDIGFMPIREEKQIFNYKDLENFYLLLSRIDNENESYLELYKGNEIIFSIQIADFWFKEGADLKTLYTTKGINRYTQWIYKEEKHLALCDSDDKWFLNSDYTIPPINIEKDGYIEIIFHYVNCKRFFITQYFAKTEADEFIIIENRFDDDDTYNYLAKFKTGRIDDISFMTYCVQTEIGGYAVYGLEVGELKKGCSRGNTPYDLWLENNIIWERIFYEKQIREILKHIYEKIGKEEELLCVPDIKYFDRTNAGQLNYLFDFLRNRSENEKYFDYEKHKVKYNEIYEKLIDSGIIEAKWKSEYELYKTTKKKYPDAIYQYRSRWLGAQSLDIFVPSLLLGIEYQGVQHYKAVGLFGGEEEFEYRVKLDERKQVLCKENGVKLMYWRYDEKISGVLLERKIKEILG